MDRLCSVCSSKISKYTNKSGICRNCKVVEHHENWPRCKNCNKKLGVFKENKTGRCLDCHRAAGGNNKGQKFSEGHKRKLSIAAKKRSRPSIETLMKRSISLKGIIPWNKGLTIKDDPRIAKLAHWKGKKLSKKHRLNIVKSIEEGRAFRRGSYRSDKNNQLNYYDSSFELYRMIILDRDANVLNWTKKHRIRIEYCHNHLDKIYLPDFLVEYKNGTRALEEIKGYNPDLQLHDSKCKAAIKYCKNKNLQYKVILYNKFFIRKYFQLNKQFNVKL